MFKPYTRAQVAFQLRQEIGAEGKNSEAFIAHDAQLDAEIVVKKVPKANFADWHAFFGESRLLYASAHPNVVQVHYACEDEDHVYLAMPFYRRGSLKRLMGEAHLSVRQIVSFGCQILSGLHNIHSKGLIHFDLKADNVLLSDRGEALISDFGLAVRTNDGGFARPDGIYDPTFPPEAAVLAEFDLRFDIYQFGLLLYCMCNGHDALRNQLSSFADPVTNLIDVPRWLAALAEGTYPDRKAFPAHVPTKLRKVVKRCLEPNPEDRYRNALSVSNDLAQVDGMHLDWLHSIEDGSRVWQKSDGRTILTLTVGADGDSKLIKIVNGGRPSRVSDGCMTNVSDRQIGQILGSQ